MKPKILGLIAVGLLAGPVSAEGNILWDWSFGGETGTFTTTGTASGGVARAANYTLTDFSVTASTAGGSLGSLSGGQYATGVLATFQPYSFDWSGSAVTEWHQSGGNAFNWWVFEDVGNSPQGPFLQPHAFFFGWNLGNINDPTSAAYWVGDNNIPRDIGPVSISVSVPEPSALGLLGLGLGVAGLSFIRRRKAN